MKLPDLTSFFNQKPKVNKTYLALELLNSGIKVIVWELVDDKITLLAQAAQEFQTDTEEDKIRACDLAISSVEEKVPPGQNLSQVVFGLTEKMVVGDKIVSSTMVFLKKLTEELSLTPVGFVVVSDAIVHFLKREEGTPPTVLLVNFSGNNLTCALVKIGKVEMVKHQDEVTNIPETLALMLKEFNAEILPARIILYDSNANLEPLRQELISYPWLSKANFMHFPKFEILGENEDLKAIAYAGSSELLSREVKFEESSSAEASEDKQSTSVPPVESTTQSTEPQKKEIVEEEKTSPLPTKSGFEGQEPEPLTLEEEEHKEKVEEIETGNVEELGFVSGQDILELRKEENSFEAEAFKDDNEEQNVEEQKEITNKEKNAQEQVKDKSFAFSSVITNITDGLGKISLPKLTLPKIKMFNFLPENMENKTPLLFAGILVLAVLGILFSSYLFLPKAKVTLMVSPKIIEKDADITIASSSSSLDITNATIPGKIIMVSENSSNSAPATGKKLTGDKAKGQVTIFNKTENSKTFPKGTVIVSSTGLKFSLDSDVIVASTSAFATSFASITANVTAVKIGTDSNLSFGTNFTFADFPASSFIAKNDNAFSGGTSRQVQAISKDDQDKLLSSLTSQLLDKAKAELGAQSNQSEKIIDETLKTTVTKKVFSAPVDSETSSFTLNLAIDFSATSYGVNDVKSVMEKVLSAQIPSEFSYQPQNTSFTAKVKKTNKDGSVLMTVAFTAKLFPKINLDEVRNKLSGQGEESGRKYLLSLPNVSDALFVFTPKMPGFLSTFPHQSNNITMIIQGQ